MSKCENDNIKASILVFPTTIKGVVPFYLADEILAVNNRISISVAISIFLEVNCEETLSLRLIKCEDGKFKGRELKKIKLDNNDESDVKRKKFTVQPNQKISDEERYRLYYTFSINNIAVIGDGMYAIALAKQEGENHYKTLATYYFKVNNMPLSMMC